MVSFDVYGRRRGTLDDARPEIERALGIQMEERDSEFQGGQYFRHGRTPDENFLLKNNINAYDDLPAERRLGQYPVLLYVNRTVRSSDIQMLMERSDTMFSLVRQNGVYIESATAPAL
ncbi:MAG: hypothetical protein ACRYGK_07955 [Janthinobacterium lividum]